MYQGMVKFQYNLKTWVDDKIASITDKSDPPIINHLEQREVKRRV